MTDAPALDRFIDAQEPVYAAALAEIRRGAKRSHWMWFIFPQLAGLGRSSTAQFYGIRGPCEALAYLDHPLLGPRYIACLQALQDLPTSDAVAVFGPVDAIKLKSSLTLFDAVRPQVLLAAALDRWCEGDRDGATLDILQRD